MSSAPRRNLSTVWCRTVEIRHNSTTRYCGCNVLSEYLMLSNEMAAAMGASGHSHRTPACGNTWRPAVLNIHQLPHDACCRVNHGARIDIEPLTEGTAQRRQRGSEFPERARGSQAATATAKSLGTPCIGRQCAASATGCILDGSESFNEGSFAGEGRAFPQLKTTSLPDT